MVFVVLVAMFWIFGFSKSADKDHADLSEQAINKEWLKARPDFKSLKTGDIIFRHGRGFISNSLLIFSREDPRYSQCGIISFIHNRPYVYHSIGGEENITNKLRLDRLETFCNPDDIHSFGIYRFDLDDKQIHKVDSMASRFYKDGLEFDTEFDLKTDEKMYCTEFVYKILTNVVNDKNYIPLSDITGKIYVSCDKIYINPHCKKIYSYIY